MEILILLLISPAIFAQRYRKHADPNDEPFLPIHPVFPHNQKLMKRGTDRDTIFQLKPELYSLRTGQNYHNYQGDQRDPYYPNYNPYPGSSASTPYSPYYEPNPYNYASSPYGTFSDPYPSNPYGSPGLYSSTPYGSPSPYHGGPYGSNPHAGYYQSPYFYPNYYNHPPHPSPEPNGPAKPGPSSDSKKQEKDKKPDTPKPRAKEGNHYVDGTNYISSNSKDLAAQSSTDKPLSTYNQLDQLITNTNFRNLHLPSSLLPQTTYKVISVGGQPVGPNYPLPNSYAKTLNVDQTLTQISAKAPMGPTQNHESPEVSYALYNVNQNALGKTNDLQFNNPNHPGQSYHTVQNASVAKPSDGQLYYVNHSTYGKTGEHNPNQNTLARIAAKYQEIQQFTQKPITRVTLEQSQGLYIPPLKIAKSQGSAYPDDSESYEEGQYHQSHEVPITHQTGYRPEQNLNYAVEHGHQPPVSYQNQHLATGPIVPQAQTYQYTNYQPVQQVSSPASQFKTSLEDVNFGAKQGNKG